MDVARMTVTSKRFSCTCRHYRQTNYFLQKTVLPFSRKPYYGNSSDCAREKVAIFVVKHASFRLVRLNFLCRGFRILTTEASVSSTDGWRDSSRIKMSRPSFTIFHNHEKSLKVDVSSRKCDGKLRSNVLRHV